MAPGIEPQLFYRVLFLKILLFLQPGDSRLKHVCVIVTHRK